MTRRFRNHGETLHIGLALLAGLGLRALFIKCFADYDGDSGVYATIAKNILTHHQFALDNPYHVTLIRVPGYPVFLAGVFQMFGFDNFDAVRWAQALIDLLSCWLIRGLFVVSDQRKAGRIALWIASLCPFTADYVAIPLTETISIFFVSLALYLCGLTLERLRKGRRITSLGVALALTSGLAMLFRPDAIVLFASIVIWLMTLAFQFPSEITRRGVGTFVVASAVLPGAWAARNAMLFHVFQPLAPRYANDPTEFVAVGFIHWARTWQAEYISSPELYWEGDDLAMDPSKLPDRAFDSGGQRDTTYKLIKDYNATCSRGNSSCYIDPPLDARFQALADARTAAHPLRSYLVLPVARLADMWLRPASNICQLTCDGGNGKIVRNRSCSLSRTLHFAP